MGKGGVRSESPGSLSGSPGPVASFQAGALRGGDLQAGGRPGGCPLNSYSSNRDSRAGMRT